jgi:ribosomal protein L11 methyltransferase
VQEYVCIKFRAEKEEEQERLVALLANAGFDGFEQDESGLKAFIRKEMFENSFTGDIRNNLPADFTIEVIPEENWNAKWESGFQPVVIKDIVAIRADFHPPVQQVKHEIVITPKMSFGTGHHATTSLMLEQMNEQDFAGSSVLDFGTGTGILAIMAEKLGAKKVIAIDNDEWSINNARENFERNNISKTELLLQDHVRFNEKFDIILANINKHVILDHIGDLAAILNKKGIILLSGILTTDEKDVEAACRKFSLQLLKKTELNGWICLSFLG